MPPKQKPGRSKQDYRTPPEFLTAVKHLLGIKAFAFDFAASDDDTVARKWWSALDNALSFDPKEWANVCRQGWGWLNPPFGDIEPWVRLCRDASKRGAHIAALLPASVGANWFRDWVMCEADEVLFLNGRLAFMPERPTWLYPKDCMLVLYRDCPRRSLTGFDVWDWRRQR